MLDYSKGINGLPKSNVIKVMLSNDTSIVVRPSGTEPKIKIYFSIKGNSLKENEEKYQLLLKQVQEMVK